MTPADWHAWIGSPAATRLLNQLVPDLPCRTPDCLEVASGGPFCVSCEAFTQELAAIRQRELNDARVAAYLRSNWTV